MEKETLDLIKEEKGMKVVTIELGSRVVNVDGNLFTGSVRVTNAELANRIMKAKDKPIEYVVDLEDAVITINDQRYSGLVQITAEMCERLKTTPQAMLEELNYHKSNVAQYNRRLRSANSGNPHQFRDKADHRHVVTINGADYVKV